MTLESTLPNILASEGIRLHENAKDKKNDGDYSEAIKLFYDASCRLESEIDGFDQGSEERNSLLRKLQDCYHKLSVAAFLNDLPEEDSVAYVKRAIEITKELETDSN